MKAALTQASSIQAGMELIIEFLSSELEASDFRAGCPIATMAAEAPEDAPRVQCSIEQAFDSYHDAIARRLVKGGLKPRRADAKRSEISSRSLIAGEKWRSCSSARK